MEHSLKSLNKSEGSEIGIREWYKLNLKIRNIRPSLYLLCLLFHALTQPATANCFRDLHRPRASNFQPIPKCNENTLHDCMSSPPVVLTLSVPSNQFASLLPDGNNQGLALDQIRKTIDLAVKTNKFWTYSCQATKEKPYDLYDCFTSNNNEKIRDSIAFYDTGLQFSSPSSTMTYLLYRPASLENYGAEYNCHPDQKNIIQLRQYHWGLERREYLQSGQIAFSNPTGAISIVLKISSIPTSNFEKIQKDNSKKMRFDFDPAAIAPILEKYLPDELR